VSHELRTPLNSILGFAQLLEMETLPQGQRRSVLQILEAGGHLLELIDEILDIEKIVSGRMTLSLEPVHVGLILDETLKLIRPIADQDGVRLVQPPDEFEVYVRADRQRLTQVFLDLLSNAVKFSRAGGDVRISGERTAKRSVPGRVRVTGVDALIAGAYVAKATFYRHFPSKDDVVAAWLRTPEARWLDVVVAELEGSPPLGRLVGFWGALGRWAEDQRFQGCPFLNTLGEIRDQEHPASPEVSSYIGEVEAYLSSNALDAGIDDAPRMGRELRFLAMGTWIAIVFEASNDPIATARTIAVTLLADGLGTTPDDVERRVAAG
jgi:AcrR family transcriptional regulator